MSILDIIPSKQLHFSIPHDTHRLVTLTNLTLHSVYILVLNSHPYELSLSRRSFLMQAFEETKLELTLNWSQESDNLSAGKLRIIYQQVEEEAGEQELRAAMLSGGGKILHEDLAIFVNLDTKSLQFLNYWAFKQEGTVSYESTAQQLDKKYYLMNRISHLSQNSQEQRKINGNQQLTNEILSYLQNLPEVISINPCDNGSFLIEFGQDKLDSCELKEFRLTTQTVVYAIKRIVSYGKPSQMDMLINIEEKTVEEPLRHRRQNPTKLNIQKKQSQKEANKSQVPKPVKEQDRTIGNKEQGKIQTEKEETKEKEKEKLNQKEGQRKQPKKTLTKQSFLGRREVGKVRSRRRNKSQERIIERQSESDSEDETEMFREQMRELKQLGLAPLPNKQQKVQEEVAVCHRQKQVKFKETSIEFAQKVLGLYIDEKEDKTEVFVILRDCVRCFTVGDPLAKKIIKFDSIYEENISMPCPIEKYKEELIFGNETILFWINLEACESEWKYVQRKYIYALSIIDELSLVAVGGKNFSKLAYFGKETSRSNFKLYSCSAADKHDHLFTYDIPGNNVGNIMNMAYITAPPHGTKLLLVYTLNTELQSTFHFLRVKAFNKIEVYGQIDIDELGILNLLNFRYNRESGRIVCMEALGDTKMDTFKRLKLKCQYEKVEVSTEGFKFPLKKYTSFQLGGSIKGGSREWMSLVDREGYLVHLHDFEEGVTEEEEVGKGDIRSAFSINNGRHLLLCTQGTIRIRQKIMTEY